MKFIEGQVQEPDDPRVVQLEDEVERLRAELAKAKADLSLASRQSARALGTLRRQLSPLYLALQDVFGELDAAGVVDAAPAASATSHVPDARLKAIWDSWKERLGPTCAKVIDALLLQPGMTNRQIAVAIGTGRIQTIYDAVAKMNRVSLLSKNGDQYSLKQL